MGELNIENVVGSGQLDAELDLTSLTEALGDRTRYEPEFHPGMYLRLCGEDGPLTTIYRTGKFHIVGAKSEDELHKIKEDTVSALSVVTEFDLSISQFKTQNFVCSGDVNHELDLAALSVGLGTEQTEYEPEQFAGLIYIPRTVDCTVLIFRSGKLIITGGNSFSDTKKAFNEVINRINQFL